LLPLILWQDLWNGQVPEQSFPELFSFAKDSTVTISKARNAVSLDQLFFEPLSDQALAQLHILLPILEDLPLRDNYYIWTYIWGNAIYSSAKCHKRLTGSAQTHPSFRWLWKTSYQHKHNARFSFGFF
jgi:hypothetical protein